MKPFSFLILALLLGIMFVVPYNLKAQTVFTNTGGSKYIKTTVDTFSVPGLTTVARKGFITNQSATKQLIVYFSGTTSGAKDTSSKVLIEPGKTLQFNVRCSKIYRNAVSDSAYSQIIIGDVQLNYNAPDLHYDYTDLPGDAVLNYIRYSEIVLPERFRFINRNLS